MNASLAFGSNLRNVLIVLLLTCAVAAHAQPYPSRPITLITPFPPAGGTDVAARLFAQQLSELVKQPVVVDNRPGAGGNLGTGTFARATADGYTLLFTAQSPITIADRISSKLPFNAERDFVPVVATQFTPVMVVVPASLPVNSLDELAALSRAAPGTLFFGSPGIGNELHLVGEWVKRDMKMDIAHVPYKGSGPALTDLLAGRIHMLIASPASVSQYIADGRLKALAILSKQRLPSLPSVPTSAESGHPQLVADAWFGLFALKSTPQEVVSFLAATAEAIAARPAYRTQVSSLGMVPVAIAPKEFRDIIKSNRAVWGSLVPFLNLSDDIYK